MRLSSSQLCLALVGGLLACLLGCTNTASGGNAKAKTNEKKKN